jgi:hypothetical protein
MTDLKQNMLDRAVESFLRADLKRRAVAVTMLGIALCIITVAAAYLFLNSKFQVTPDTAPVPYLKLLWMGKGH